MVEHVSAPIVVSDHAVVVAEFYRKQLGILLQDASHEAGRRRAAFRLRLWRVAFRSPSGHAAPSAAACRIALGQRATAPPWPARSTTFP